MLDRYVEANKHAQRRMAAHLKPIDALLMRWAPEARHDGAPRWPTGTMLHRIIEQGSLGASQAGKGATLAAPPDVEFADWAVASLRDEQRKVIFAEYVQCPGWSVERKRRRIGLSGYAWKHALEESRANIYTLCRTFGRMLRLEIC